MNRKIFIGVALLAVVMTAAWSFRRPLSAAFGGGAAAEDPHTEADHSSHAASAGDPHAGHAMPDSGAQEQPPGPGTAKGSKGERKVLYWYDPMHPAYRADKPGFAPDCGMALVPKYADGVAAMKDMPAGTVRVSAEKQQLIGVKLGHAEVRSLTKTIRAVAKITYDETQLSHAHTKVEGWIEKVYVDYVGAPVKYGDPLFTLYSPELLSTQQEYLIALKAKRELADSPTPEIARSTEALYQAARERLLLWDISQEQIHKLEETGQPERAVTFYAEHRGYVTERKALPHMRVEKNTDLYMIADLSRVWAIAEVYEYEAPLVQVGQAARMTVAALPGRTFTGKVNYIFPALDPQTRTLRVRLDFDNPGMALRPEMFANVELAADLGRQVVVAEDALLDSGMKQYVFVHRGEGYFEPREVRVGMRTGGWVAIEHGLKRGDEIVVSGNFLIDSESKLKAAADQMSGHQH